MSNRFPPNSRGPSSPQTAPEFSHLALASLITQIPPLTRWPWSTMAAVPSHLRAGLTYAGRPERNTTCGRPEESALLRVGLSSQKLTAASPSAAIFAVPPRPYWHHWLHAAKNDDSPSQVWAWLHHGFERFFWGSHFMHCFLSLGRLPICWAIPPTVDGNIIQIWDPDVRNLPADGSACLPPSYTSQVWRTSPRKFPESDADTFLRLLRKKKHDIHRFTYSKFEKM